MAILVVWVVLDLTTPLGDDYEPSQGAGVTAAPKPPAEQPLWTVPYPPDGGYLEEDPLPTDLVGSWLTDTAVVRGDAKSVTAYDQITGTPTWSLPAPGDVQYCGMSGTTENGLGVVAFGGIGTAGQIQGRNQLCNQLQAVDLANGVPRWTVELAPPDDNDALDNVFTRPEITDGVVVMPSKQAGGLAGYDAVTGMLRWELDVSSVNPIAVRDGAQPGTCSELDLAVGQGNALVTLGCSAHAFVFGGEVTVMLAVDVATGTPRWLTPIPPELVPPGSQQNVRAVSASPPVAVYSNPLGGQTSSVLPFDPVTGALTRTVTASGDTFQPSVANQFNPPARALVEGNILVTTGAQSELDLDMSGKQCSFGNSVSAVDLTNGTLLWNKATDDRCGHSLVGIENGAVVTINGGDRTRPPRLTRFPLDGGEPRVDRILAPDPTDGGETLEGVVHQAARRLFVLPYVAVRHDFAVLAVRR